MATFWPRLKVNFGHASVDFGHASVILATRLHDFGHEFGIGGQKFWPRRVLFWPRSNFGHALATHAFGCSAVACRPKCGQNSSFGCILATHAFGCSPVACRPKCGQNILATYSREVICASIQVSQCQHRDVVHLFHLVRLVRIEPVVLRLSFSFSPLVLRLFSFSPLVLRLLVMYSPPFVQVKKLPLPRRKLF